MDAALAQTYGTGASQFRCFIWICLVWITSCSIFGSLSPWISESAFARSCACLVLRLTYPAVLNAVPGAAKELALSDYDFGLLQVRRPRGHMMSHSLRPP
jgi:hypothetical protein